MNNITESIVSIAVAIIGVTILAVLVSKRSNTVGVIQSAATGFSSVLATAVSPIGNPVTPNMSYPTVGLGGYSPSFSLQ